MIDSNIVDRLLADPATVVRIEHLRASGAVAVLYTHVQRDELRAVPDPVRRDALLAVLERVGTLAPTNVWVVGVSPLGPETEMGGERSHDTYDAVRKGTLKHTNDALIAATAEGRCDVLVTEEARLRSQSAARGVRAETYEGLLALLSVL